MRISSVAWPATVLGGTLSLTAAAIFAPLAAALVVVGVTYLWSFTWRVQRFFALHFSLAVIALVGVPILRLTSAENNLRIAVLTILVSTSMAVAIRTRGGASSRGLIPTVLAFFFLALVATSLTPDPNEWSFYGVEVATAFAALCFARAAAKLDAWPIVARVLIIVTAAEAVLGIYEVFRLSSPIWRGGRILTDGSSTWLRNELVASIPRAQGTFGHPLPLAFCLIIGAVLLVRTRVWHGALRFMLFLILSGGVFVSGSRNAIVLFVGLTLLAFILPSFVTRAGLVWPLVAVSLILMFPLLSDKLDVLVESGSVYHRLGAVDAIPNLLSEARSFTAVLIGDGSASSPRLYSLGLLQNDGLAAVDNQYVLTLAQNGLIGLLLLIIVFAMGFHRAPATIRLLLLVVTASGMIYDLFAWPSAGFLVWLVIAAAWSRMPGTGPSPIVTSPPQAKPARITASMS